MGMVTKWRVTWKESERGWGFSYFDRDYDTQEEAQAAIRASNREVAESGYVPDYYIVPVTGAVEVEVDDES